MLTNVKVNSFYLTVLIFIFTKNKNNQSIKKIKIFFSSKTNNFIIIEFYVDNLLKIFSILFAIKILTDRL